MLAPNSLRAPCFSGGGAHPRAFDACPVIHQNHRSGSGDLMRAATSTHDAAVQMVKTNDPNSPFTYDDDGRSTSAATSSPAGQPLVTLTYGYNETGERTSLADSLSSVGRITYVYQGQGPKGQRPPIRWTSLCHQPQGRPPSLGKTGTPGEMRRLGDYRDRHGQSSSNLQIPQEKKPCKCGRTSCNSLPFPWRERAHAGPLGSIAPQRHRRPSP